MDQSTPTPSPAGRVATAVERGASPVPAPIPGPGKAAAVVVLHERDLEDDLATAIQRIRADEATSRSRILVVAKEEPAEDAEDAPTEAAGLAAARMPAAPPPVPRQLVRLAEQAVLETLGSRLQPLVGCLDRFLDEARCAVAELRSGADATAGTTQLDEILDWTAAVAQDLAFEADAARHGRQVVDTRDLLAEVAGSVEGSMPSVRVAVEPGEPTLTLGRPAELAEAFSLALALVARRIGGQGLVQASFERTPDGIVHRILGHGEPRSVPAEEAVARFRRLVVERHGGRVYPDLLGAHGAGFCLLLPALT